MTTFDLTTNFSNLSLMSLNCFLLNRTVIDLIPIVHWDKIWVKIAKNFEMRTSGGGGGGWGSSVISDTPGQGGGGGQKRANFCERPLWMAPYIFDVKMLIVAVRGRSHMTSSNFQHILPPSPLLSSFVINPKPP